MQRDSWPVVHLVREANKNVLDWRSRLTPLVFFAVLAGIAQVAFGAYQSTTFLHRLEEQKLAGRNILIFSAADPKTPVTIDRRSCEGLASSKAVDRSGLVQRTGTVELVQLGPNIPRLSASATLFPLLNENDVLIGSALLKNTTSKSFALLGADGIARAQVAPRQPTGIETNSAIIVGFSPQTTTGNTCVVVMDNLINLETVRSQVSASLVSSGGPLRATQLFTDASDPIADFLDRPDRFLPLLLAVLGGLSAGILNRLRSTELAAYRLSGTTARSLYLLLGFEQMLLSGFMVLSAALGIVVLHSYFVSPLSAVLSAFSAGCAWIAVVAILTIDLPLRRPPDLAKDRG